MDREGLTNFMSNELTNFNLLDLHHRGGSMISRRDKRKCKSDTPVLAERLSMVFSQSREVDFKLAEVDKISGLQQRDLDWIDSSSRGFMDKVSAVLRSGNYGKDGKERLSLLPLLLPLLPLPYSPPPP